MAKDKSPKLRTVNKSVSAFPLNEFPKEFPFLLGKELIYMLASKGKPELEGSDWENIFAKLVGIYIVFLVLWITRSVFNALKDYLKQIPTYSDKPIDSYIQVIMIILWSFGALTIILFINII